MPAPDDVTQLLLDWSHGDQEALTKLMPVVYDELRRLAACYLRRERPDHTLQPTALVHEVYLRLIDQSRVRWQSRAHFLGIAAQLMRRILVDHSRRRYAAKREGSHRKLSLDDALTSLAAIDPQQSRIVELRFFGGLTVEETAAVVGASPATVKLNGVPTVLSEDFSDGVLLEGVRFLNPFAETFDITWLQTQR
jgi:DNA-directed RNA polymerase specialized sigma24 family protein